MTIIERIDAMRKALDEGRIAAFETPDIVKSHGCFYDYRHHGHPNLCCAIGATLTQQERDDLAGDGMLGSSVREIADRLEVEDDEEIAVLDAFQTLHDDAYSTLDATLDAISLGDAREIVALKTRLIERFGRDSAITKEVFAAALEIARELVLARKKGE